MKKNLNEIRKNKISWTTVIGVVISLVLMIATFRLLIINVDNEILDANIASMEELALHDKKSIQNSIELRWDTMEGASVRMTARKWNSISELQVALKELLNNVPSVDKIIMLDDDGTEYSSNGVVRSNSYIKEICDSKTERFITRINTTSFFRENRQEMLFEAIPIDFNVDGHHMQWMICEFPIDMLESELKITSYNENGFSSVIDDEGNYIINISRSHNFGTYDNFFTDMTDAEIDGYDSFEDFHASIDEKAQSAVYELDGREYIIVVTNMDFSGWHFVTIVPTEVFQTQTNSILLIFLTLLGVISVCAFSIVYITLRQRSARDRLRIAKAENKSKTEFLFNMSHDIRTPMNAILGYTDIGLRHVDDVEQAKANFKKIKTAGGHLLNLINDILEMSRIEAGKVELTNAPVDIKSAINGVVQMNQSLATAKSIEFITDTNNIKNFFVYADELHINEIIINLISNAIKYTPTGGKIKYTAEQISDVTNGIARYRFEIADNGIGMSDEFQKHLFEAFSREESSGVSKIEGAGLGLSIVKRIVDLAKGTIEVKSKLGEGSVFTVELPFKVMTDEEITEFKNAQNAAKEIPADEKFFGKKVLLVEDNEMNREIATEILTDAGLIVETAEDGEIAVEKVAENGIEFYDFILMDIQMPVMNGYEATRAIRSLQDGNRIPIIALSANAFEEDKQASVNAGMNDHVAKPINIQELFSALAKFV